MSASDTLRSSDRRGSAGLGVRKAAGAAIGALARPLWVITLVGSGLVLGVFLTVLIGWTALPGLSSARWSLPDVAAWDVAASDVAAWDLLSSDLSSWDAASWLPLALLASVAAVWGAVGSAPWRGGMVHSGVGDSGAGCATADTSAPGRADRARSQQEVVVVRPTELGRPQAEFLGTVCHELRTPLTVVCGYSELLLTQGPPLEPAAARMVERIEAASGQLARLVDDLLDFSRIERGELVVHSTDFDVVPVLQEVVDGFRHLPGAARVHVDLPHSLPVHGDTVRIAQSTANFLSNALKYAPQGSITLRAIVTGTATVRVEVEDSGPGIPQAEQGRVWETFYRSGDLARAGSARGTGIGLAVVKALVEAQGGAVGLCSAPGEGSRFWFDLPATAPISV
ncbi:MAG: HAMP domain-containing histidine kinase [Chloroflexota bacterium]|nr:HAMP domain-containing histidine kinase [Chloroflexota bacterium]